VQIFFSERKSLSGYAKISIFNLYLYQANPIAIKPEEEKKNNKKHKKKEQLTLSYLKIIKCCLPIKYR